MAYLVEYGDKILHLKCSDDEIKKVKYRTVKFSSTILQLLEDISSGGIRAYNNEIIPLNLDSKIFDKVLAWLVQHESDVESMDDNEDTDWDNTYMKVEKRLVFDIMMAANYLNITRLSNLTCKVVSTMIKGRNPEEIRDIFNYEIA